MAVQSYKDLTVWRKSFELTKQVYRITKKLPPDELYGLTSQMRRCSVSIPSNIAEGQQRNNLKEYRQFLGIAKGSAAELETQLLICQEVYSLEVNDELSLLDEVQKMLNALVRNLQPKT